MPLYEVHDHQLVRFLFLRGLAGEDGLLRGADETEWKACGFPAKPGDPERTPPWISPYHYCLDWQMGFAAMSSPRRHPWLLRLVAELLGEYLPALSAEDPTVRQVLRAG